MGGLADIQLEDSFATRVTNADTHMATKMTVTFLDQHLLRPSNGLSITAILQCHRHDRIQQHQVLGHILHYANPYANTGIFVGQDITQDRCTAKVIFSMNSIC